jgi:hypothetical protein
MQSIRRTFPSFIGAFQIAVSIFADERLSLAGYRNRGRTGTEQQRQTAGILQPKLSARDAAIPNPAIAS